MSRENLKGQNYGITLEDQKIIKELIEGDSNEKPSDVPLEVKYVPYLKSFEKIEKVVAFYRELYGQTFIDPDLPLEAQPSGVEAIVNMLYTIGTGLPFRLSSHTPTFTWQTSANKLLDLSVLPGQAASKITGYEGLGEARNRLHLVLLNPTQDNPTVGYVEEYFSPTADLFTTEFPPNTFTRTESGDNALLLQLATPGFEVTKKHEVLTISQDKGVLRVNGFSRNEEKWWYYKKGDNHYNVSHLEIPFEERKGQIVVPNAGEINSTAGILLSSEPDVQQIAKQDFLQRELRRKQLSLYGLTPRRKNEA